MYPRPLPFPFAAEMRRKQCGFDGGSPKVCCRRTPPQPAQEEAQVVVAREEPPDVSGHPNLKLLPTKRCGEISHNYRITSGSEALVGEFPWMALLLYVTGEETSIKVYNLIKKLLVNA